MGKCCIGQEITETNSSFLEQGYETHAGLRLFAPAPLDKNNKRKIKQGIGWQEVGRTTMIQTGLKMGPDLKILLYKFWSRYLCKHKARRLKSVVNVNIIN